MASEERGLVEKISSVHVSEYPYKHFVITDFLSTGQVENLKIDLNSLEGTIPTNIYTSTNGEKKEWRLFEELADRFVDLESQVQSKLNKIIIT